MGKRGVTLLEVLVAMSISLILAGITLMSMTVLGRQRLTAETTALSSHISWTRELAKTQHYNYFLSFDLANEAYTIRQDSDDDGNYDTSDTVVKQQDMTVDIVSFQAFDGGTITPARVMFAKFTGKANQDVVITLQHAGGTREISIFSDTGYDRGGRRGRRIRPRRGRGGRRCFIATAAYSGQHDGIGRPQEKPEEVRVLEKFRDTYLSTSRIGRQAEDLYYEVSPSLADYIAEREWARITARFLLKPVVWGAKKMVGEK
jgi:prepilin-type N-terminal cleavage/methylation domain-containing protein